jgi:cytochrome b6-f complex iron-sulfur subunit
MADETSQDPSPDQPEPKAQPEQVGPVVKTVPAKEQGALPASGKVPPRPEKKAAGLKKGAAVEGDQNIWRYSRRGFMEKVGWVSMFSFLGVMLTGSMRFMFPRVLFEPSPIFRAGFSEEYLPGTVSTKWMKDFRVWIIRTQDSIYALSGVCTHLGCTPRWLPKDDKFKCPCHGSGFYRTGVNFEGPAPRALERFKVARAENGEIIVDRSIKFEFEKGGWENPQSFLAV